MRARTILVASACAVAGVTAQAELEVLARFHVGTGQTRTIEVTPDGRRFASGGALGDLIVRNVADGAVVHRSSTGDRPIGAVRFAPDGERFAALGAELTVWRLGDEKPYARVAAAGEAALAFSADGRMIACLVDPRTVVLRDPDSLRMLQRFTHPQLVHAHRLAFSPDGRFLAVGERPAVVHVFDVATSAHLERISTFGDVEGLGYMPGGTLVFATDRGRLRVGSRDFAIPEGLHDLVVDAKGGLLMCGEGFVERRDPDGRTRSLSSAGGRSCGIANGVVVVAALDHGVRMTPADGADILLGGQAAAIASVGFDGDDIVVETFDGMRMRRSADGVVQRVPGPRTDPYITRRAATVDGAIEIVAGARYGTVLVDHATGSTRTIAESQMADASWRSDGSLCAVGVLQMRRDGMDARGEVALFDRRGDRVATWKGDGAFPTGVAFHADGKSFYVADGTTLARVAVDGLRVLAQRRIDLRFVRALDANRLIAHDGRAVHVLDAESLKLLTTHELLDERILHASYDAATQRICVALLRDVVVLRAR